jgi:hypothetical protein
MRSSRPPPSGYRFRCSAQVGAEQPGAPSLSTRQEGSGSRFAAHGATEADAKRALTEMLTKASARLGEGPVLVIGGGAGYANCLHVILPESHAWVVWVVRDGHRTISWHGDSGRDERLRHVLEHVGGQPAVIAFESSIESQLPKQGPKKLGSMIRDGCLPGWSGRHMPLPQPLGP